MNVFLSIVGFSVFESARHFVFESRTNVFLSATAETAVETRHVFHRLLQNREEFPEATSRNLK
jgi:hypothetical protein